MEQWQRKYLQHYITFLQKQHCVTFLLDFIDCQCQNDLASGAKQRHWIGSEQILRFMKDIRHCSSGRACMKLLSGAGNNGAISNKNSNTNFNLHVPSNRTLDLYEDPGYYGIPPANDV